MHRATVLIDVERIPVLLLWVFAIIGCGILVATLLRIMPPAVRRGSGRNSVLLGTALYFIWAGASGGSRAVLWYGAVGFAVSAIPLSMIGKLPSDMPSAKDPAIRDH